MQEQPCALCFLKINIPSSLRIPGLRWPALKLEVVWDQSGKGWTQNCLHLPVWRAVIPKKGTVSNVFALFITRDQAESEELPPCEIFAEAADKTALIVMEL